MPKKTDEGFFTPLVVTFPDRYKAAWEPIYQHLHGKGINTPTVLDVGSSSGEATADLGRYLKGKGMNPYLIGIDAQADRLRDIQRQMKINPQNPDAIGVEGPPENLPDIYQNLDEVVRIVIGPKDNPIPYGSNSIDVVIMHTMW